MSESDLEYVSKVSGVDFLSLREKYKKSYNPTTTLSNTTTTNELPASIQHNKTATDEKLGKKNVNIDEVLSKYHICKACNGLGVIKSIYNHMTLETTCEECDGDSIILQDNYEKAVASLHPIDER